MNLFQLMFLKQTDKFSQIVMFYKQLKSIR